jgi:hypothetical protein
MCPEFQPDDRAILAVPAILDIDLAKLRRVTFAEWEAEMRPSGVWIELGPQPAKHPIVPDTRYDKENNVWWFPGPNGSRVVGIPSPHPLLGD